MLPKQQKIFPRFDKNLTKLKLIKNLARQKNQTFLLFSHFNWEKTNSGQNEKDKEKAEENRESSKYLSDVRKSCLKFLFR